MTIWFPATSFVVISFAVMWLEAITTSVALGSVSFEIMAVPIHVQETPSILRRLDAIDDGKEKQRWCVATTAIHLRYQHKAEATCYIHTSHYHPRRRINRRNAVTTASHPSCLLRHGRTLSSVIPPAVMHANRNCTYVNKKMQSVRDPAHPEPASLNARTCFQQRRPPIA